MSITEQDINHIAQLAGLQLGLDETAQAKQELTGILTLIQQLQTANTTGTEPMVYPLCGQQQAELRLRSDNARPTATTEQRDQLMANAPATENGLFLVPTVIE